MASIRRNTCAMAASSGFYQSPGPPPLGNVHHKVPMHCHGHQNGQQSVNFFIIVLFAVALAATGAIRSK
jgi:hypothetical protein